MAFGDPVVPAPTLEPFPTLLANSPAPTVLTYPRETVVAEKYEAIVRLGEVNTRLKDSFDLWVLQDQFEFTGTLAEAIKQTFSSRGMDIPEAAPFALPQTFVVGVGTERWRAFLGRTDLEAPPFPDVMELLARFLVSLTRFPGHLDCGDLVAQGGVRDGYQVPTRVSEAGGRARAAA